MSLIAETANPLLERALLDKLLRRGEGPGSLGELEPVAVRLGLLQHSLKPRFREPQLVVFAADHGLAVDGLHPSAGKQTDEMALQILDGQQPLAAFARQMGLALSVVDCGLASQLPAHERLLQRKIAHGTRNTRVGQAMTVDQAHAAIRAGMEIGDTLPGNLVACAGLGVGSLESAALVLARLTDTPARELVNAGPSMSPETLAQVMIIVQGAQGRHRDVADPVEVLAAFGGFEVAMMVGVMLVAASKRHLIMVDGLAACAALLVASRIAPAVTDYCVFCRSRNHHGLDKALSLFQASALLELGLDTLDGTGACLSWPLVRSAAALLSEVIDAEELPSRPAGFEAPQVHSLYDPAHPDIPGLHGR
ncbi:nicotinate-nucleotide--dimethylbenzimidazole phosphoribosyltransferase [Ideonella sp. DXS22W]|uniref:Nicotinate-nucleotide--dimethylbenzimidazole phosphoribosyltransferase n=1 Tax=Pseudaquabacterium inlustre TaxID=2984192 RepID=A0ABU9CP49_9BURK